jgi:signal transduction histidine kinase
MSQTDAAHPVRPQPDYLTTLERLLAIQATAVKPALDAASTLIAQALRADKVDAFLYDAAITSLVAVGTSQTPMGQRQHALGLDRLALANGGRTVEVFQTGVPYHSGQVDTDEHELLGVREGLGIRSAMLVPLDVNGERRGAVQADSAQPDHFTAADLAFTEAVAHWLSLLLQRVELVERQQREAEAVARHLVAEELVTVLAHDLGNYLTPLMGTLHLLARRAARDGRTTDVKLTDQAARSVARLHRLTADLLDASRVEQGLLQIRRQPTDLAELVRDTTDGLRMPHATLAVEVPDELLAEVDPDRLQQVLENLLSNARTHAPGSPVVVTLRREDRPHGAWAVLRVHDQGPGIAPAVLDHLMTRFVRGTHSKGLGLGLYLAHSIAQAHGGTLTVDSTLGQGTTFQLAVPLATG